ncbi:MAG TPA: hypothetical protein VJN68_02275 [Burkholderiaceae bacterium]|nr:hypothetical protein [Burkholderiaceae bacterium]
MTRIATLILAVAVVLALATVGCGGTSPSSSGVDGSRQVSSLSTSEKTSMCTWFAGLVGGYGTMPSCSMAVISAPDSEADCLSTFPSCAVTVATFQTCVNSLISAQMTCTTQALQSAEVTAACQTVGEAGCF